MSNPKTAIEEIKKLMVKFGFMSEEKPVELNFLDAKLVDGTEIKVQGDSFIEGASVVVVTAEGEIPAPDGTHEIESGMKITTVGGLITEVEEPGEEPEVPAEEPVVEEPMVEEGDPIVSAMVEAITPLLEEIKSLREEIKGMKEKMTSVEADFNSFKAEPAGKKIADGKVEKFENAEDARVKAIMNLRNKK